MQRLQSERVSRRRVGGPGAAICWVLYLALQFGFIATAQSASAWPDEGEDWLQGVEETSSQPAEENRHWLDRLTISGYLKNETAYRYDEPRSITKIRNILYLKAEYPLADNVNLHASGWAYHDLAYQLFDYETIAARFVRDSDKPLVFVDNLLQEKDTPVVDLRELYMDVLLEDMDIRIGRQFIIWGVFDGIRITDEINPLDFRELVLPDLLDYRIPLWSLKLDYYLQQGSWEFIWIPDIRFHKPAPRGSEWELLQEVSGTTANNVEYHTTYPRTMTLDSSEFGFRFKTNIQDAQIELSYFYTWDDFPVIFRTVKIDSTIDPQFYPTYTRINIFGATFVKPVGDTILKAELAYVPDKYFGLNRDVDLDNDGYLDGDGVVKLKHYRWALGVDFSMWGIDFSPAISQWLILDYQSGLIQDRNDTSFTLFARKPIPENSIVLQVLLIALINMDELYIKPKASFDVSDRFKISVGMDLFYGLKSKLGVSAASGAVATLTAVEQSAQFFGNFHDNDRVFVEFKYTF